MKFKNKISKYLCIILIIVLIIAQPIYYQYQKSTNSISVYQVERTTDDLALTIENLTLVYLEKGLYIQPDCLIRTNINNQDKIEDIELNVSIDKKEIIKTYIADISGNLNFEYPTFVKNVQINDSSILHIKLIYSINGVKHEFFEDLRLKDNKIELVET